MRKTVSAIVPAHNEQKTVRLVVETLLKSPTISEVVCINDGSIDKTQEILESFGDKIKLVFLKKNRGKGYAMAKGVETATGDIVAFFDGDLTNLSNDHIQTLVTPLLENTARVVLGQSTIGNKMTNYLFWSITGQRAYYRADLLPHAAEIEKIGFGGVEIYMNSLFKKKDIKYVRLKNLDLLIKHQKHGVRKALHGYTIEGVEIAQEFAKQKGFMPRKGILPAVMPIYENIEDLPKTIRKIARKTFNDLL